MSGYSGHGRLSSKSRKKKSIADLKDKIIARPNVCIFCENDEENDELYGKMLHKCGITVHYFCMLFSSGLSQKGKTEKDGIYGFMPDNILNEKARGYRLKCAYCKKNGATIGCVVKNCRRVFHFGCGQRNGTLHQYFDSYVSFCQVHRPRQFCPLSDRLSFFGTANTICVICMNTVEARASNDIMRAPCCKNTWFHRGCIQKQSMAAGLHFFKCPVCNDKDLFQAEMLQFGIYIPEQDAAWEMEPNAYQELLERYNHCDAVRCFCPGGRKYNKDGTKWEILVCCWCGSQGSHINCAQQGNKNEWSCRDCTEIDEALKKERGENPMDKELATTSKFNHSLGKGSLKLSKTNERESNKLRRSLRPRTKVVKLSLSLEKEYVDVESVSNLSKDSDGVQQQSTHKWDQGHQRKRLESRHLCGAQAELAGSPNGRNFSVAEKENCADSKMQVSGCCKSKCNNSTKKKKPCFRAEKSPKGSQHQLLLSPQLTNRHRLDCESGTRNNSRCGERDKKTKIKNTPTFAAASVSPAKSQANPSKRIPGDNVYHCAQYEMRRKSGGKPINRGQRILRSNSSLVKWNFLKDKQKRASKSAVLKKKYVKNSKKGDFELINATKSLTKFPNINNQNISRDDEDDDDCKIVSCNEIFQSKSNYWRKLYGSSASGNSNAEKMNLPFTTRHSCDDNSCFNFEQISNGAADEKTKEHKEKTNDVWYSAFCNQSTSDLMTASTPTHGVCSSIVHTKDNSRSFNVNIPWPLLFLSENIKLRKSSVDSSSHCSSSSLVSVIEIDDDDDDDNISSQDWNNFRPSANYVKSDYKPSSSFRKESCSH